MKNKLIAPWLLILGLVCGLGGWVWTQSSETLNLPPSATVGQNVTASMNNLAVSQDYLVDWSDGTTDSFNTARATSQNLSHAYSSAGTFLVLLKRVTAAAGQPVVAQASLSVTWLPCNIALTPTNTVLGGTTDVTVSGLAASRAWNFDWGDGTIVPFNSSATGGFTGNHVFATSGVYPLKVTTVPLSAGMSGTMICLVSAQVSLPVPTLVVAPSSQTLGSAVNATLGNLVSSVAYNLDWGDGSSVPIAGVTTIMVNHTFTTASNFSVKLTATGITPVIQLVTIVNPTAAMTVTPNPVFVGDLATANISNLNAAVNYSLNWGDGSSQTIGGSANIISQHAYAVPATYLVQLTAAGFVPVVQSLSVTVPIPTLNLSASSLMVGQVVTANVANLVSFIVYTLDWGDGSSDAVSGAVTAAPTHVYAALGTFVVKLLATGIVPVTQPITIGINTPSLLLSASSITLGQITEATVGQLVSSVAYTLDWGDGSSDPITGVTTLVVPHTYATAGTFTVKLSATGIAPLIVPVTVSIPVPTLLLESNTLNLGTKAKVTLGNLLAVVDYSFDWGDGSSDAIIAKTSLVLTHQYTKAGVFAVKLSAKGIAPVIDTITVSIPVATLSIAPNPVNLGTPIVAKLLGLATGVNYTLEWGDTTSDTITGVSSASLKHTYAEAGTFLLKLTYQGGVPVLDTVKIEIPVPTLALGQNSLNPGQSVTAALGNLLPVVTYSLEWGDNTPSEIVSGVSSAAPKHSYAVAGNYIVKLFYPNNAPVIEALVVSVPVANLDLKPNPALPNQVVIANASQLLTAVDYSLEWGDGEITSINGKTSVSLQHSYTALGQYIVKLRYAGGADIVKPLTVSLAALNESLSFIGNQSANAIITFNLSGLLQSPDYDYSLVFGESNEFAVVNVKADGTASLKHTYLNAGIKVVQLRINGIGANNLLRGTITLNLGAAMQVSSLNLVFQPQASVNINLKQLTKQLATLSVAYTGSGLLEGNWFLDNQLLEPASLNLAANKTLGSLNLDVPTSIEGVHKLYFKTIPDPSSPNAVAVISNTITYTVTPAKLPTTLEIGGFSLEITSLTNPVLTELAGTASLDLIVGGVMAAENLAIDFTGLKVTMNGTIAKVITGQLEKKLIPALELNSPLALAPQKMRLVKVLLTTSGAKLDGNLPLLRPSCIKLENVSNFNAPALEKLSQSPPSPKAPPYTPTSAANQNAVSLAEAALVSGDRFEFSNQALLPNGDLYATGTTISNSFKIGCTGVSLQANQAATLDLSSSQSPNTLAGAYSADPTPPNLGATWQGLFFVNAKLELAGLIKGLAYAPLALSNGGYNFHLKLIGTSPFASPKTPNGSLPNPNTIVEDWNFKINNLELGVNQTEVVLGKATGSTKIAFLNETLNVVFHWQPDATWAISSKGTISHDFGKTRVDTGLGAFIKQNQSLVLKFSCATWAIGAIATSDSDLYGFATGNTDFCANGELNSTLEPGGLFSNARDSYSQPLYSPVITPNFKQDLQSSVMVDLAGLGISANGQTSLNNSYAWQPLQGGGDLKLLGFAFPVTKIAVLQQVDRYYLALQGELEMGRLNANTPLPTRKSSVRYYVKNGKDETMVMDKAAYQADVNATTKFKLAANTQTWQIASLGTITTLFGKNKTEKPLLKSSNSSRLELSKKVANSADFEFADGGTIDIEGMSATVSAAFGLKGGVDYFFVWANVDSVAPLFSLGVMSFFEFHGGLAHHMKWATGKYRQSPTFDPNTVLQIQVGAVLGTPTDGSTIHLDGTVLVDITGGVEIYADGWIFTTVADGYKAKAKPVLRAYIGISKDRLLLQACVGKSSPPQAGISCSDLSDLSFYGVATANGWLELYIPFKSTHFHLYVGTYANRINANFFQIYKATGYIMFGYLEGDQKPPVNTGGLSSQAPDGFGLAAGGSIAYDFYKHDEGSAICNWEWHFGFHYKIAADFLVEVTPKFLLDASVSFSAGFTAGAHVCGIGANFEIDIDLYGHIHAPKPTEFDGKAKLYIDLPIIPTFTVKVSVSIQF